MFSHENIHKDLESEQLEADLLNFLWRTTQKDLYVQNGQANEVFSFQPIHCTKFASWSYVIQMSYPKNGTRYNSELFPFITTSNFAIKDLILFMIPACLCYFHERLVPQSRQQSWWCSCSLCNSSAGCRSLLHSLPDVVYEWHTQCYTEKKDTTNFQKNKQVMIWISYQNKHNLIMYDICMIMIFGPDLKRTRQYSYMVIPDGSMTSIF